MIAVIDPTRESAPDRHLSSVELEEVLLQLVRSHGRSSNSFQLLYGGFRYFGDLTGDEAPGLIAFASTPFAWMAAAEPLCSDENIGTLIDRFVDAARSHGKETVFLPVGEKLARLAESRGLQAWPIGLEPYLELSRRRTPISDTLRSHPSARALLSKGAVIEPFNPLEISPREHFELDAVTDRWLRSRKSTPLGFLNRLEPWRFSEHKRYFWLRYHGHVQGYVTANPIPATGSWYLIDLIRDPDSPAGTTELLVISAAQHLQDKGAVEVSLGLSPLAGAPWGNTSARYPRLARMVYERGTFFYSFQPLFAFKSKFAPDRWETRYLLSSGNLGPGALYAILRAHYPQGLARASAGSFFRAFSQVNPAPLLLSQVSPRIVARSLPRTLSELLFRARATLSLCAVNILFFLATSDGTHIRYWIAKKYAYSWTGLGDPSGVSSDSLKALLLSPFLHWDLFHIGFNLVTFAIFGTLLELLAGSMLLILCFVAGILFSNLLTSSIGILILRSARAVLPLLGRDSFFSIPALEAYQHFVSDMDIGCSLGVFAGMGGLAWFLRHSTVFLAIWGIGVVIYSIQSGHWLELNHLTAMLLGYLIARRYVPVN